MEKEKIVSANDLLLSVRDDPEIDGKHFARFKEHINHAPDVWKHGRWRWRKDGSSHFFCSECEIGVPYSYTAHKYCPNCGAKMDGDGNG